jgi:hypothetical protein
MSTPTTNDPNEPNDLYDNACDDGTWPALIAAGSALFLGYLIGRATFSRDVRAAFRQIEESPEPIDVFIPTLGI